MTRWTLALAAAVVLSTSTVGLAQRWDGNRVEARARQAWYDHADAQRAFDRAERRWQQAERWYPPGDQRRINAWNDWLAAKDNHDRAQRRFQQYYDWDDHRQTWVRADDWQNNVAQRDWRDGRRDRYADRYYGDRYGNRYDPRWDRGYSRWDNRYDRRLQGQRVGAGIGAQVGDMFGPRGAAVGQSIGALIGDEAVRR